MVASLTPELYRYIAHNREFVYVLLCVLTIQSGNLLGVIGILKEKTDIS